MISQGFFNALQPSQGCEPDDFTSNVYWQPTDAVSSVNWNASTNKWEINYPIAVGSGYMRIKPTGSWAPTYRPKSMLIKIEMSGINTSTYPSEWVLQTTRGSRVFANYATDFSNPIFVNLLSPVLTGDIIGIRHTWDFGTPTTGSVRISSIIFDDCYTGFFNQDYYESTSGPDTTWTPPEGGVVPVSGTSTFNVLPAIAGSFLYLTTGQQITFDIEYYGSSPTNAFNYLEVDLHTTEANRGSPVVATTLLLNTSSGLRRNFVLTVPIGHLNTQVGYLTFFQNFSYFPIIVRSMTIS